MPTFNDIITFLQRRAQIEETQIYKSTSNLQSVINRKVSNSRLFQRSQQSYATTTNIACVYCKGNHRISACESFRKLSPHDRYEAVKKANLCLNCLRAKHRVADCSSSMCHTCNKKHHTLLHFEQVKEQQSSAQKPSTSNSEVDKPSNPQTYSVQAGTVSILATAIVDLVNAQGKVRTCRAFLDSGSQPNFVTEEVASFLNLPRKAVDISVGGIKDTSAEISNIVSATLKSRYNNFKKDLSFFVLSQITQPMPGKQLNISELNIPSNIILADPDFHLSSKIDLLIGVQVFYKLLCVGQISLDTHPDLVLQKTHFGWIIAGEFNSSLSNSRNLHCHLTTHSPSLESTLTKFWEIEELPCFKPLSVEERACEQHFIENTQRNINGRYIVRLPFNDKKHMLGDSFSMSSHRFNYLERRLSREENLKSEYCKFLDEYKALGHPTIGETLLTFEQLETLVIEIEAISNSRPLSPLSPDPNDLHPLTPGHFLIGGALASFHQTDFSEVPANRLSCWQHIQKMRTHFWQRWRKEYLHQLATRSKWSLNVNNQIDIGTLVIIKDDNAPPLHWTTGRVTALLTGDDGINRVAMVKTNKGEYKRCLKKLCPLPITHVNEQKIE